MEASSLRIGVRLRGLAVGSGHEAAEVLVPVLTDRIRPRPHRQIAYTKNSNFDDTSEIGRVSCHILALPVEVSKRLYNVGHYDEQRHIQSTLVYKQG